MKLLEGEKLRAKPLVSHWAWRYGLAIVLFGATLGLSLLLNYFNTRVNLTIPIVLALVIGAWFGGRGPGLLVAVLFEAAALIYLTVPPDSSIPKVIFAQFSVFALYVFLVLVISGLHKIQHRLSEQRDLLRVTLTSIGDGVITTDTDGRVTFMNPVAEELTGWNAAAARGVSLEDVFNVVNEETGEVVSNPVSTVLATGRVVGLANHTILVSKSGGRRPIDDSAAPIRDNGEVKGVVLVFADVTERKLAERSRRESEIMHRLVEAQESERLRIARDLHDHLGQKMTALRLQIDGLGRQNVNDPDLALAIAAAQNAASHIDRDIGFLSWELRPTELEDLGLVDALSSFVREWSRQYGIAAEFHTSKFDVDEVENRLSQSVETNLYRIVQEALNNVLKHADAQNVSVLLQLRKDQLVLITEDNGCGFELDVSSNPRGLGLIGMQERAALLKGDLEIDSERGTGTTVMVRIPLNQ